MAVVKVGAATETEMKEKKHRVEDALQATRAALEEGIVPGGGVALLSAAGSIKLDDFGDPDERTGAQIIIRALEEPLRQLAYNAGLEGSVVVDKVRKAAKGQGLNVDTNEIEDLVKAGIIDPTMVTRSALQNAASIAKNILMTEAIVAEPPEKAGAGRMRRHGRHGRHGRNDVRQAACKPKPSVQREGRPEGRPSASLGADELDTTPRSRLVLAHVGWNSGGPAQIVFGALLMSRRPQELERVPVSAFASSAARS